MATTREFSLVSPGFWTGATGKAIRKAGLEAQVVSLYMVTGPHANMWGLFSLPVAYISADTGIVPDRVVAAIRALCEAKFCSYDFASEMIWVHEMARFQVAETLAPNDKRVINLRRTYIALPENFLLGLFWDRYHEAFHLEQRRGGCAPAAVPQPASVPEPSGQTISEPSVQQASPAPAKPATSPAPSVEAAPSELVLTATAPVGGDAGAKSTQLQEAFQQFWAAYPKKKDKPDGEKAFSSVFRKSGVTRFDPDVCAAMMEALAKQKVSPDWVKDGGQFIPYPATWLRGRRWEDEVVDLAQLGNPKIEAAFEDLWAAYPRKEGRQAALAEFYRVFAEGLQPALMAEINAALELQKYSQPWIKDGGQFIPSLATWLADEAWREGQSCRGNAFSVAGKNYMRGVDQLAATPGVRVF